MGRSSNFGKRRTRPTPNSVIQNSPVFLLTKTPSGVEKPPPGLGPVRIVPARAFPTVVKSTLSKIIRRLLAESAT